MRVKSVGRRRVEANSSARICDEISAMQRLLNKLRGGALVPKGVYRFAKFSEAHAWMTTQMARTHARHTSKTS